ncbi:MAG: hypothetical protein ACLQDV_28280 [Candidatus Binataceae bacterium]
MKRLALTLVAGVFGTLMMLPGAHAQDTQNMNNDAGTIQGDRNFHQEEEKTVEDYVNGVGGTATHEQVDVQKRSTKVQNDALGSTTTRKQVDVQQRTDDLRVNNNGMNDSTADRSGDDND